MLNFTRIQPVFDPYSIRIASVHTFGISGPVAGVKGRRSDASHRHRGQRFRTLERGGVSPAPILIYAPTTPVTQNTSTGSRMPLKVISPRDSTVKSSSTAILVRGLIRISPSCASSHRREARLIAVPEAV